MPAQRPTHVCQCLPGAEKHLTSSPLPLYTVLPPRTIIPLRIVVFVHTVLILYVVLLLHAVFLILVLVSQLKRIPVIRPIRRTRRTVALSSLPALGTDDNKLLLAYAGFAPLARFDLPKVV